MNWTLTVLTVCFLLAAFLLWQEFRRANKIHLVWRIMASLVTVIALACIILPVSYSGELALAGNNDAVLLTKGFNADSLPPYQDSRIFTTDKSIAKAYPKAKLINLTYLKTDSPAIARLHIFGYGLDEDGLQELNLPVVFHAAQLPDGITSISWNAQLKEGESLRLQGSYQNSTDKPVKLVLKGLNTDLDTVTIHSKYGKQFELSTIPKHTGRAIYNLLAVTGTDTLANEVVPVEITPVKPLKILILTASPDFETRFLKNWLTGNGYGVAIRSAISKDKFVKEYVNTGSLPLDHLSAAILDKFDVVLGDLSTLKTLNADESALLKQQVSQKGLGVIVRADSSSKAVSWLQSSFPVDYVSAKDQVVAAFNIQGKKGISSKLKTDPNYIRAWEGTQPLIQDEKARIVVSSAQYGAGRLIFSTLSNTFNWALAGDKNNYEAFWSLLISKAARKEPVTEQWYVHTFMPASGDPAILQLETAAQPAIINIDGAVSAPLQNPLVPFEWSSIYWPLTAGWHPVNQGNGAAAWWYVYPNDGWKTVRALKEISDTRQYVLNHPAGKLAAKIAQQKVQIPISKMYFYILLLAALTYLWVENKLNPTQPSPEGKGFKN